MPIGAVISNKIFCVHARIHKPAKLFEITKEDAYSYVRNELSKIYGINPSSRESGIRTFDEDVFEELLRVNELERIVRGHGG